MKIDVVNLIKFLVIVAFLTPILRFIYNKIVDSEYFELILERIKVLQNQWKERYGKNSSTNASSFQWFTTQTIFDSVHVELRKGMLVKGKEYHLKRGATSNETKEPTQQCLVVMIMLPELQTQKVADTSTRVSVVNVVLAIHV